MATKYCNKVKYVNASKNAYMYIKVFDARTRHILRCCVMTRASVFHAPVAPRGNKNVAIQALSCQCWSCNSRKMKYLIFISLFLIQFVFGEEDPSFEESNDIPEGKIAVCFKKNCNWIFAPKITKIVLSLEYLNFCTKHSLINC